MDDPTPDAGTSSQEPGDPGDVGSGGEVARLQSENTKLRQNLAKTEELSSRAVPLVRIAQALINAPGGKEIVEKLERGESLTKKEAAQAAAATSVVADKPLTKKEATELFEGMLEKAVGGFGQTVAAERKAADSMKELDDRATKELEGYQNAKQDPQFQGWVGSVLDQVKEGTMVLPKGEDNLWWFAVKTAHKVFHSLAPESTKKKGETDRVAEILAGGGSKPSSTGSVKSDVPEELKAEIERIRGYGSRTLAGKSFANKR